LAGNHLIAKPKRENHKAGRNQMIAGRAKSAQPPPMHHHHPVARIIQTVESRPITHAINLTIKQVKIIKSIMMVTVVYRSLADRLLRVLLMCTSNTYQHRKAPTATSTTTTTIAIT